MVDKRKPRKGSMAFRPRKRAESQNPRVFWPPREEKRILGLAGYKVGMTHVAYIDPTNSPTRGKEVVSAATIIEVPPIHVYGIRLYGEDGSLGDVMAEDKNLLKKVGVRKNAKSLKVDDELLSKVVDVRLLVFIEPEKTTIGKKHIERFELGCGGADVKERFEFAKSFLGKQLKASDVLKEGEFVDVVAVTKGKGWQGPVKRFGVSIQRRKATGKRRHVGTLGPFHPAYILYTVPQAGQMGYHKRTELNKLVFKVGTDPKEINRDGGFHKYGLVKNEYVLLKGSVPGPTKRLVKMRLADREREGFGGLQLTYVSR